MSEFPNEVVFKDAAASAVDPLCVVPLDGPKVAILLCTYEGQEHLVEQLHSFERQSHANWEVIASDDGSIDETLAIMQAYRLKWGAERLSFRAGPAKGFAANFLSLTCDSSIQADYFAYSDQDDVWESEKLQRALDWLQAVPRDVPALYCGRTRLVDCRNFGIGLSPLFSKPPSFGNALMQNIGGGNTMVFNNAARQLMLEAGDKLDVVTHDWWAYLVVTGCGGRVLYDSRPLVRYRQHGHNLVGMNNSWGARMIRLRMLVLGQFKNWNDRNIAALQAVEHKLTAENQHALNMFALGRRQPLFQRLSQFRRCGITRQTLLSNMALFLAAVIGKV